MTRSGNSDVGVQSPDVLAQLRLVIWEADLSPFRFTFVSQDARDAFGYPVRHWLVRPNFWARHIHPSDRKRVLAAYRRVGRHGRNLQIQYRFLGAGKRLLWLRDRVCLIKTDGGSKLCGAMIDLSTLKQQEDHLRSSESRYRALYHARLNLEDERRQKVASRLYDSTSQQLAALKIHLGVIRASSLELSPKAGRALGECLALAEECSQQVRTLSHWLHPPMLEEFGLVSALRSYLDSLRNFTGMRVRLVFDQHFRSCRLPKQQEAAIFRIIQEALTYAQLRSAAAVGLEVSMPPEAKELVFRVTGRDQHRLTRVPAQGSRDTPPVDIQLVSIRERVEQLGGTLRVKTSKRADTLTVTLPLLASV